MSQEVVGVVIDRLLTDEDLRIRFVTDPMETLAGLCAPGAELTTHEMDLFLQTNARIWFWIHPQIGTHAH